MHGAKIQKRSESTKNNAEKFGSYEKTLYICSVKMKIMTIRAESRVGVRLHRHCSIMKSRSYCGMAFSICSTNDKMLI